MDSSNKQRLIGVMVLVALATIVLPVVFHQSSQRNLALSIPQTAPPPPPVSQIQIVAPTANTPVTEKMVVTNFEEDNPASSSTTSQAQSANTTPSVDASAPSHRNAEAARSSETTKTNASTLSKLSHNVVKASHVAVKPVKKVLSHHKTLPKTVAWDVQLGSFSDAKNAQNMVHTLRKNGFNAYTKIGVVGKDKATRVFIGPELERQRAQSIQRQLLAKLHIKSIVVKHPL